jgi:hypothetical protein
MKNMIELVRIEEGQEEGNVVSSTTLTEGPLTPW